MIVKVSKNLKPWEHTFNIMLSRKAEYEIFIQNDLKDIKIYGQNKDVKILSTVLLLMSLWVTDILRLFQRSYLNRSW